jgi:hypothetical protein
MPRKYNVQEIFDRYKENPYLTHADIFHLYDTGEECYVNNTGYHDSRIFNLIVFNTVTMEKRNLGQHDGITADIMSIIPLKMIRVYADGSFFISLLKPAKLDVFQDVRLMNNEMEIEELIHNDVCQKCGNTGRCEPRTLDSPDGQECDCNNENK